MHRCFFSFLVALGIMLSAANTLSETTGQFVEGPPKVPVYVKQSEEQKAPPSIPNHVLDAVRSTLMSGGYNIDDKVFDGQILKVKWLTINARGRLVLSRMDVPWIAIAAEEMFIQTAMAENDIAVITRRSDDQFSIDGRNGNPSPSKAPSGGYDTGQNGVAGSEGEWGSPGQRVQLPQLYFFVQKVHVDSPSPPAPYYVKVAYDGVRGGNGGNGGRGQDGGDGGRGTPSECENVTFPVNVCIKCKAGPGDGGRGGDGGIGGRGGDGADGSDGGNVFFVGPRDALKPFGLFHVTHRGGALGRGGADGSPGDAGRGAGGGYQCKCCPQGGGSRGNGNAPSPSTRGPGNDGKQKGQEGSHWPIERDNSDLFAVVR